MKNSVQDLLTREFHIDRDILALIEESEKDVSGRFQELDDMMAYNQYKVLAAFQKNNIRDMHFSWTTGYGYDDAGRDALEQVYADIFHTEAALVRPLIVSGTHALTLALTGPLRPGDELIYSSGGPYDTLEEVIGIRGEGKGSLKEFDIEYKQVELTEKGGIDYDALGKAIGPKTKMVCLQRATGYAWRKAITIEEIEEWAAFVKGINPQIICMVDNCYGEFLHGKEPTDVGADIMAGSLIKNPGGGIALAGGYVAGRADLIEKAAYRMTSPGVGSDSGLMFGQTRAMLQGLFTAPKTVNGAVKGAVLCARAFEKLGYAICPGVDDIRSDIIQAVRLGSPEAVTAFCRGIQAAAPVDCGVRPVPCDMDGYGDQVVMAAGTFVQGSSIELSADAPMREPYTVYFQGGLTYEHAKFGVMKAMQELKERGLLNR
ncbi:MAG: methionine gamma-lyase family protein [Bacillota bacterium]|nr:methionine gamma-lyase family protein [Bacillota bacterium]